MKKNKIYRIGGLVLLAVILVIGGLVAYVKWFLPDIPLEEVRVEITPERVERGKYLANHVTVCIDCHSGRDWSKFSGPVVPGTEGKGGEVFDEKMGFPGRFVAPNITPFALKDWTDAEIYRAITAGVSKDGRALFPIMPYPFYGSMETEDIYSIIAYLRTLPEVESEPVSSEASFPFSLILHTIPKQGTPGVRPAKGVTIEYGKYLADAAACIECHTQAEKGQIIPEKAFAGGRTFPMPGGTLSSANITPDKETGIGNWTPEAFIARFKALSLENVSLGTVGPNDFNSMMPWTMYAGMDSTDLLAIYTYLRSVKPISNPVKPFIARVQ